jgi:hypothetical protein
MEVDPPVLGRTERTLTGLPDPRETMPDICAAQAHSPATSHTGLVATVNRTRSGSDHSTSL